MAPQRVAGAVTVSPYTYDARAEHGQGRGTSAANSTTMTTAPATIATNATATSAENQNADRGVLGKGKKGKAKPRAERPPRQEEEMRFNTGPRSLRAPQANRGGRRGFRIPGRTYPEDQNGIPDYPPPSFQEAMTTPPVSVCSSTTSLPLAPALPLIIPENILEDPRESIDQPTAVEAVNEVQTSDNDLDFEGTMFIIDRNSVPVCSTDLPRGAALEERVKSDWLKRRGVEFPGKSSADASSASKPSDGINALTSGRGRSTIRLLTPLLIDPEPKSEDLGAVPSSPKRRFLSLSPLRTIFPPRSPTREDRATSSAHPSPSSPYSTSRSLFFRSSSSLATASFLRLPMLSSPHVGKREPLSRKIFKKGKQGSPNSEQLEVWEVLTEETYAGVDEEGKEKECVEHPRSLLSAVESIQSHSNGDTSPTKSVSFMLGTPRVSEASASRTRRPLVLPEATEEERRTLGLPQASHDTFLRDWKGSSQLFLDRSVHRNRSPTPEAPPANASITHRNTMPAASESTLSLTPGPPLVTVRVRAVSPPPPPSLVLKHTAQVAHPSPLRLGAHLSAVADAQSAAEAAMYQRALDTPLPMTPIFYNQFDHGGSVAALNDEDNLESPPPMPHSARALPSSLTNANSAQHDHTQASGFAGATSVPPTLSIAIHPSATMSMTPEVVKTNSVEEPMTPTRHHYAGRPLPRPPPRTPNSGRRVRAVVDSTYASSETLIDSGDSAFNSCPEGLLIDLEDTTLDTIPASGATTPLSDLFNSQAHLPLSQASSSSVDLLAEPPSMNLNTSRNLLSRSRHSPGAAGQTAAVQQSGNALSELTDLDLLVSRLADEDPNGTDYETLLLLSEVIGPATSTSTSSPTLTRNLNPNTSAQASSNASATTSCTKPEILPSGNISLIGRIEVKRRRTTKAGVVKLKLTLLDVAVNKCGICLFQFKDADMAALTSDCQHSFHESCLGRWLARSKSCPLCRVPLDADVR